MRNGAARAAVVVVVGCGKDRARHLGHVSVTVTGEPTSKCGNGPFRTLCSGQSQNRENVTPGPIFMLHCNKKHPTFLAVHDSSGPKGAILPGAALNWGLPC